MDEAYYEKICKVAERFVNQISVPQDELRAALDEVLGSGNWAAEALGDVFDAMTRIKTEQRQSDS